MYGKHTPDMHAMLYWYKHVHAHEQLTFTECYLRLILKAQLLHAYVPSLYCTVHESKPGASTCAAVSMKC